MKKIFYGIATLAFLSIAYCFFIFLPKTRNYEMQEKCAQSAEKFIETQKTLINDQYTLEAVTPNYECHFNKKLNKCFVKMEVSSPPEKLIRYFLIDVLENKDYGVCSQYKDGSTQSWMGNPMNSMNNYQWIEASKKYLSE